MASTSWPGMATKPPGPAAALGIPLDSPVVRCAARVERERGQRFKFRLRAGKGVFATGRVDGGAVYAVYTGGADFPASVRDRFVAFLRSLPLGVVLSEECGPDAEPGAADVTMNVKPRLRDDGR